MKRVVINFSLHAFKPALCRKKSGNRRGIERITCSGLYGNYNISVILITNINSIYTAVKQAV
jgi:hypothetical protein